MAQGAHTRLVSHLKNNLTLNLLALFASTSLLFSRGFGSTLAFRLIVAVVFGLILYNCITTKRYVYTIITISSVLLAILYWPIVFLYGFWAFLLSFGVTNQRKEMLNVDSANFNAGLSSGVLFLWLIQLTTVGSWTHQPIAGILTFSISAILLSFLPGQIRLVLATTCIVVTAISLVSISPSAVAIEYHEELASGYSHGPVLQKLTNGSLMPPGKVSGDIGITNLMFGEHENKATKKIFLVDHDVIASQRHPVLINKNLIQKRPWSANQFYGDQYLLAAIATDGYWISNLGGCLRPEGRILLASNRYIGGDSFEPIVIAVGDATYVQDSDPFVDRLACYQSSAITELTYGSTLLRYINLLFAFAILVSRLLPNIIVFLVVITFLIFSETLPTTGDVRLVVDRGLPHEPSRGSGVMRSLIDAGYPYLPGTTDARILIVGPGRSTRVQSSEKIVFVSSGSTIAIDEHVLTVDQIPLGTVDGIVDARVLYLDGVEAGVTTTVSNVVFVGTDSPAKQDWTRWLR